jgi:DNA-binding SARP family transcriptional activator/tetratricopeptide (TPR) repeat protein
MVTAPGCSLVADGSRTSAEAYAHAVDLMFLGPFEVSGPAGQVQMGATKERLLLALLALRANEVVSTAQVIDGLWGEDPPPTAVKTVHAHVARVRRMLESAGLPGVLVTREPGYFLQADPEHIDAVRFEQHALAGRRALADGDPKAAEAELAAGLALWRGDALSDCRDDSEEISAAAVRLDELRLNAIEDHIDAQLALGRHAAVIGDLESLVVRFPLRERMWGALMIGLYRAQRQADALRAYQRARDVLVERLGVEPTAELRRLETAILEGDPSLDLVVVRRASPASERLVGWATSGPAFVGRDSELTSLKDLWTGARDGQRQIVMISGEPGIGKTRLAAEVALHAHGDGARVLYGRCDEGLGVPYQPFVEALREYVEACDDDELERGLGRYPNELVRLVPELATRMTEVAPPLHSDPATEQYRLFEAVVEWLAAAVDRNPVVLVLDDLHWAAQPTVLLLRHVMRSERAGRLMMLTTYRPSELDRAHPLAEMLADVHVSAPAPQLDRVELRGLDASAVAAFVEAASGQDLDEAGQRFAESVHLETAGNPFFVSEIVRSLWESAETDPSGLPADPAPVESAWPDDVRIPSAARDVVLRRVDRLSDNARQVLTLAAVVGSEFDVELFEPLGERDLDALLRTLEEALDAGLIDEAGRNRFSFAHAIVRGALYDRLSETRRVHLHGRVADAIESVYASELREHLSELAYHYADANSHKAVPYAIDAAQVALDRLAFEDAVTVCRRGLAAVERADDGPVSPSEECDLLFALGRAELASGHLRGRGTLLRAYEVARELNDARRQAASVLAINRGFFARIGRTDRDLVDAIEHAIEVQPPGDTTELAELLATLASELVWADDGERRFELSDRAVAMARRIGNPRTLARVLMLRSMTIPAPDTLPERLSVSSELLDLGEELGDPAITFDTAFSYSGTAWEVGDVPTINLMEEIATALAAELRQPRLEWQASFMRTARRLLEGELDEAERNAGLTLELGRRAGLDGEAFIFYTEQLLEIRRWQRRLGELIEDFRDLAGNDAIDFGYSLTRYLYDSGEHDAARAAYEKIMDRLALPPRRDMLAITTLYNVGYLAAKLGDTMRAPAIYDALLPYGSAFTSTTVARPIGHHFLGMLASTLGEREAARRHFESATQAQSDARAPLLLAETQLEHARLLVGTGDPGLATLVGSVRAAAVAHGARFLGLECDEIDVAL